MFSACSVAIALFVVTVAGAAGHGSTGYTNPQLLATVGPGFTISLTDAAGARVTHLDPGTFDVVVDDQSDEHNFHLQGPGVSEFTDVAFVGKKTWTVTLTDGDYRFVCDVHPGTMRGTFSVGTPPPPTPTPTPVKKLVGTVGPGFSISLTSGGRAAKTLKAGRFDVVVRDRSSKHNFHLVGPGVNRKTGVAFKGTLTWKVKLGKGTLRFLCDPHAKTLRGSVKVL